MLSKEISLPPSPFISLSLPSSLCVCGGMGDGWVDGARVRAHSPPLGRAIKIIFALTKGASEKADLKGPDELF